MDRRNRGYTALLLSLSLLIGIGTQAMAQEGQPSPEEMAKWQEIMTPGPHHQKLAEAVGTWETTSKMWMQPGQPPMETKGEATVVSVMDGRFIEEVSKATMMGMPWEGRGVFGYDNDLKKHIGTWFDSFGTMMLHFEGDCDGSCSVVTVFADYKDPMSGETARMKSVSKIVDADHHTLELFNVEKDGSETKMVVVDYRRKK